MSRGVYITGVAGFLGSNIARRHLDAGDRVYGCDTFITSDEGSRHLAELRRDGLRFVIMDVRDPQFVETLLHGDIDVIYNMACPASPPLYQAHPVLTTLTSVVGTHNVLQAAAILKATVVHASTSEVYGDPLVSPQREEHAGSVHAWGPRSCYDSGKMAAEALCYDMRQQRGVDVRVARIFNTYGPNMRLDDGRVITNFVKQALRGEPVTVYGGHQTRSFCYVDDLVDALVLLGRDPTLDPKGPVNIGNPHEFSVRELALLVERKVGRRIVIKGCDLPIHDPQQRRPDISLAKRLLDWEPKISLDVGLERFVKYAKTVI